MTLCTTILAFIVLVNTTLVAIISIKIKTFDIGIITKSICLLIVLSNSVIGCNQLLNHCSCSRFLFYYFIKMMLAGKNQFNDILV